MLNRSRFVIAVVALGIGTGISNNAVAQSADAMETAATNMKLRELYDEGLKYLAAANPEKAYAAFLTGWKVRPHYRFAGNLAAVELSLRRYRDAAEHASFFLREAPELEAGDGRAQRLEERRRAQAILNQAQQRVAVLNVHVEPSGADVWLNRNLVGKAPLPGPLYVDPGPYQLEARLEGRPAALQTGELQAGSSANVRLEFPPRTSSRPSIEPSVPSPASGTLAIGDSSPQASAGPSARTIVALTTAGLAVASASLATVFYLGGASANRDVENASQRLSSSGVSCGSTFNDDCAQLSDAVDRRSSARGLAVGTAVAAGAFAASTAMILLLWRPSSPDAAAQARFVVAPFESGGVWVGAAGSL